MHSEPICTPKQFQDVLRRYDGGSQFYSALTEHPDCCELRSQAISILGLYGLSEAEFILNYLVGAYDA